MNAPSAVPQNSQSIDRQQASSSHPQSQQYKQQQYPPVMQDSLQSDRWLLIAKNNLKENTMMRLNGRMDLLEKVLRDVISPYGTDFVIHHTLRHLIFRQVLSVIDQYCGTKKLSRNQEASQKDVLNKTRTWWNRSKSSALGSTLFVVICFYALHNFIQSQFPALSSRKKLMLFIDTLQKCMDETIKFPNTKPKPLIPHRCILNKGEFKDICSSFVILFGDDSIKWNCYFKTIKSSVQNGKKQFKYIKQKDRSKSLYLEFRKCLDQIKRKWCDSYNVDDIEGLMQKWDEAVQSYAPKTYHLSFYEQNTLYNNQQSSTVQKRQNTVQYTQNTCCNSHESLMNNEYQRRSTPEQKIEQIICTCTCCYMTNPIYRRFTKQNNPQNNECSPRSFEREFQGMGDFANHNQRLRYIDHSKGIRDNNREEHIQKMRSQFQSNINKTNIDNNPNLECDPYFEDLNNFVAFGDDDMSFWDLCTEPEVTYNVI